MIFLKRTTHKIKHKKQKKLSYLKVIQSLELFGLIHLNDFLIIVSIRQPVPQQGKFSLSLSLSLSLDVPFKKSSFLLEKLEECVEVI